jgi:hypothetical protein
MSVKLSILSLLALLLTACGPGTPVGYDDYDTLLLDSDAATRATVPPAVAKGQRTPLSVNAAKARVPHQYDDQEPLSLFDFNTNLNPASNR